MWVRFSSQFTSVPMDEQVRIPVHPRIYEESKLKIPIDQIFPDPDLPRTKRPDGRRENTRSVRSKRDPVVLSTDNGYLLLAGERKLTAAKKAGEVVVECTVKEEVTTQERWELSLSEQYHSSLVPAMELCQRGDAAAAVRADPKAIVVVVVLPTRELAQQVQ